jgi:hypothetical protein
MSGKYDHNIDTFFILLQKAVVDAYKTLYINPPMPATNANAIRLADLLFLLSEAQPKNALIIPSPPKF